MAVNALGNSTPVMFVFPRLRYHEHFVRDGPPGCIGVGNSSGWMQDKEFVIFLRHFQKHTNSSLSHKVLLLLDNHASHITIDALDFCRSNGIVMLSLPPHCSHKLQPLDRSVYGPFKKAVNSACDAWIRNHPGKPMTIYDIPGITATALPLALTQNNIQAGFKCTGVFPFNRQIFSETDFGPSFVTDRELPTSDQELIVNNEQAHNASAESENIDAPVPAMYISTSSSAEKLPATDGILNKAISCLSTLSSNQLLDRDIAKPSTSTEIVKFMPEEVRPFAKAPPRKTTNRGKKKRKSAIYTDTPEKMEIEKEIEERNKNRVKKNFGQAQEKPTYKRLQKKKSKILKEDSEDEEGYYCLVCVESYGRSKPGENWIQCIECKMWSHEECVGQTFSYVCHNCDSD